MAKEVTKSGAVKDIFGKLAMLGKCINIKSNFLKNVLSQSQFYFNSFGQAILQ